MKHLMHSTHLHHVYDVVRQPEQSEGDDDHQNEFLAADASAKARLADSAQYAHITAYDHTVRQQEGQHRFHTVLHHHLQMNNSGQEISQLQQRLKTLRMIF